MENVIVDVIWNETIFIFLIKFGANSARKWNLSIISDGIQPIFSTQPMQISHNEQFVFIEIRYENSNRVSYILSSD